MQPRSDDSGNAEGSVPCAFSQTATVNSQGITSTFPEAQTETQDFTVVMEDNQWRISSARMACGWMALSLECVFSPCRLYFYDRAFRYAVPDIRWFPGMIAILSAGAYSDDWSGVHLKDVAFSALNESMSLETANMSDATRMFWFAFRANSWTTTVWRACVSRLCTAWRTLRSG